MELNRIAKNTKLFLFDLDGTLYCGETIFPFTKELLEEIRRQRKEYKFITNNSSKSREDYAVKMKAVHHLDVKTEDFVTSGSATVRFIQENYPQEPLFVLGTESLKNEFIGAGLPVTDDLERVGCIVVGYDT